MAQHCVELKCAARYRTQIKLTIVQEDHREHIQAVFHASKKWNARRCMSGRAISCMTSTAGQKPGQTSQSQHL